MTPDMNAAVSSAIDSLRKCFPESVVMVDPDGAGGARVAVETVSLSGHYNQSETWIAGHLVAQLPYADIYPLFVRGDLTRSDGRSLGSGLSNGQMFLGRSAVQVSRRSNHRDPAIETAAHKFMKVIEWLRHHPGT